MWFLVTEVTSSAGSSRCTSKSRRCGYCRIISVNLHLVVVRVNNSLSLQSNVDHEEFFKHCFQTVAPRKIPEPRNDRLQLLSVTARGNIFGKWNRSVPCLKNVNNLNWVSRDNYFGRSSNREVNSSENCTTNENKRQLSSKCIQYHVFSCTL